MEIRVQSAGHGSTTLLRAGVHLHPNGNTSAFAGISSLWACAPAVDLCLLLHSGIQRFVDVSSTGLHLCCVLCGNGTSER